MSDDAPDLEALAKRFLDLWQDQVAASVADPALAEWLARFLAAPGGPGAATKTTKDGETLNETAAFADETAAFADIFAAMASRTAPAAASYGAGDDRLDELARRLAECEKRLSALESGAQQPGGKPRKRAQKRTG